MPFIDDSVFEKKEKKIEIMSKIEKKKEQAIINEQAKGNEKKSRFIWTIQK
jgi:hypothetical protein